MTAPTPQKIPPVIYVLHFASPDEVGTFAENPHHGGHAYHADHVLAALQSKYAALKAVADGMAGTLEYLHIQAKNGTLHPQVVVQNTDLAIKKYKGVTDGV